MNLVELQRKLLAAARAHPPSDRVPYAFEKRVLARLQAAALPDIWAEWAQALWRGAALCLLLMLLLGAWHLALTFNAPADGSAPTNLSQDFEHTVLVAVDQDQAPESLW